jgi:hypothetical protein
MRIHAFILFAVVGCASAPHRAEVSTKPIGATSSSPPVATSSYADAAKWVCRPGDAQDACNGDLTATALLADGTRRPEPLVAARDPGVDCFYVYPTLDMHLAARNHDDFEDTSAQRRTTLAQVGRFSEACAVWAPLYRQVTIGTYLGDRDRLEEGLALAFGDVEAAFREYLARAAPNRKIVVVGHSQGAEMIIRLVKKFFDHDAAMRARLLLAMPIGGDVDSGTFENVPACTKPDEIGCVVAYRTYAANAAVNVPPRWVPQAGRTATCVNPASIDGGSGRFSHAYFPSSGPKRRFMHGLDGVDTAYVDLPDFYAGKCVTRADGFSYLEVSAAPRAGDSRVSVVDLDRQLGFAKMGLHILDMQIAQGDLVAMIARRSAKLSEVAPSEKPR